jgi:hypothetical protein
MTVLVSLVPLFVSAILAISIAIWTSDEEFDEDIKEDFLMPMFLMTRFRVRIDDSCQFEGLF